MSKHPVIGKNKGVSATADAQQDVSVSKVTQQLADRVLGGGVIMMREQELRSIYALFAWVANEQNASEETVRCITETRFGVNDVRKLATKDYDEVIKFLVDLRIDELCN